MGSVVFADSPARPGRRSGFARSSSQSRNPNLHRKGGLILAAPTSFGGDTGIEVVDVIGGRDGTFTGGMDQDNWIPSDNDRLPSGHSINFDGINDYVNFGTDPFLQMGTDDYSFAFWIKSTFPNSIEGILSTRISSTFYFEIKEFNGAFQIFINATSGTKLLSPSTTYDDDFWHHVAVTFDRDGDMSIYKDGVFDASVDMSSLDGDDITGNGQLRWGNSTQGFFTGNMADLLIYRRVLEASDVEKLYINSQAPFQVQPLVYTKSTSQIITPTPATAIGATVDPTIVFGSATVTPTPAAAIAATVNPTIILPSLVLSPGIASAIASVVMPPTVILSVVPDPQRPFFLEADGTYEITRARGRPGIITRLTNSTSNPETGVRVDDTIQEQIRWIVKQPTTYSQRMAAESAGQQVGDTTFIIWTSDINFVVPTTDDFIDFNLRRFEIISSKIEETACILTVKELVI